MTVTRERVAATGPRGAHAKGRKFLIGALMMGVLLAVCYAGRVVLGAVPYPPGGIQDLIARLMPGNVDKVAIRDLQHWAQKSLWIGIHVALVAIGGWVATIFARPASPPRKARWAIAVAAGLFLAASVLGLTGQQGVSWPAFFIYAACAYAYARVVSGTGFLKIVEPEVRPGETPLDAMQRSRRSFLGRTVIVGGTVALLGGAILRLLTKKSNRVALVPAAQPFSPPASDPTFPAVSGLTPEITATSDFYNVDIDFLKPNVDVSTWVLTVRGLVQHSFDLTFDQLQHDFEVVELAHTLSCISNDVGGNLISTAVWRGVRLADVLNRAGLAGNVQEIVFNAADGYSDSVPLARAMQTDTLVVFAMNGVQLPTEHGFPARVIIPGLFGMKQPKWLTSIVAVDSHYNGYWEVRGWDQNAVMVTESRIDVPAASATVSLPAKLAGVAWAGDRGIQKVEVSYDGGNTWTAAQLNRPLSPVAWRQWAVDVASGTGSRRVVVRATDGTGTPQTEAVADPEPSGATGWDFTTFQVH